MAVTGDEMRLLDVGPFDERIFLYMDDVDFQCVVFIDGWLARLVCRRQFTAHTLHGGLMRQSPGKVSPEALRFNRWFLRRHGFRQAAGAPSRAVHRIWRSRNISHTGRRDGFPEHDLVALCACRPDAPPALVSIRP